jgi:protein KRI1
MSEEESEEYSSEDEDAVLLTDRVEEKLLETVARIKSKDPSIYKVVDPIFADDDFEDHHSQHKTKDKKFTYKDLLN